MDTVQKAGQRRTFLSAASARPAEKTFIRLIVALALLVFIAATPFVRVPVGRIPPFSPGYEAAIWICDMLTAVLLFSQFVRLRSRAVLVLAAGYLFAACMVVPHALSFPGVLSATGLIGSGLPTTIWLYMCWHAGFPVVRACLCHVCAPQKRCHGRVPGACDRRRHRHGCPVRHRADRACDNRPRPAARGDP